MCQRKKNEWLLLASCKLIQSSATSRSNLHYRLKHCISLSSAPDWYLSLFKKLLERDPPHPPKSPPPKVLIYVTSDSKEPPCEYKLKTEGGCQREKRSCSKAIKSDTGWDDVPAFKKTPQVHWCQTCACQLRARSLRCLLQKTCFVLLSDSNGELRDLENGKTC